MDDTVYTVTVHVAARDGVMKVESVTYTANGEAVDGITFYNTTVPDKPTPPTPPDEPDEDIPNEDIPDEDVPLTDTPEEPDTPEEEEPLEDLEDPDVPLADVPQTGDNSGPWLVLTLASGTGLAVLTIVGRKRETEMD